MSTSGHTEEAVLDAGNHGGVRQVTISDETFVFHAVGIPDRKVTGAQIAQAAGKHPADDYAILLNLPSGEVETLRPDELVDLDGQGVERFFVIKSGESYRFTVDGLSLEWPLKSLAGKHIKVLVHAGGD